MKALIITVGTRGDIQPYLALAIGLKNAGHEVAICTCPRFEAFIADYEIRFFPLEEGLLEILDSKFGRAIVGNINNLIGALRTVPKVIKQVGPIHRRMVDDAWSATEAYSPDVLIYHPKMFCVPAFAAQRNIPAVLALLIPMQVPTGERPFFGLPRLPFGPAYNRMTYSLIQALTKLGTKSYLKKWRKEHDPEGASRESSPSQIKGGDPIPVIHGYSQAIIPTPKDWPAHASTTGYWFLPQPKIDASNWTPSKALVEFLSSDPKPIYIGFGSMAGTDAQSTTETIIAAIEEAGVRAVLATGWGGLTKTTLPPSIHMLETAPHDWLFPHVSAVVHHGGAGTTATGLKHGCPTIICPFALDQPFWGRLVHELGAGPKPIPQNHLTASNLADAITQATTDPNILEVAQRIETAINAENGIQNAITQIERTVTNHRDLNHHHP